MNIKVAITDTNNRGPGLPSDADVVVVAGTPAGCAAAIAAARRGHSVVILEATTTLGGMTANGLSLSDLHHSMSASGVYERFVELAEAHYVSQQPLDPLYATPNRAMTYWEPHIASEIWSDLVDEHPSIKVVFGAVAIGVVGSEGRIQGVEWETAADAMGGISGDGRRSTLTASVVIDCTYEGDIAAWSGVEYRLGREARSEVEPHAGIIYTNYSDRDFDGEWGPATILPGSTGASSDSIMAFNSKALLKVYEGRGASDAHLIEEPPDGYDPEWFMWDDDSQRRRAGSGGVRVPGGGLHLNVWYRGNDLVGPNRDLVLAHPRERTTLREVFNNHLLAFLYHIQHHAGDRTLGLPDAEFEDNRGLPRYIYVREGRRIRGKYTMTEADVTSPTASIGGRPTQKPDSVAVGDYPIDCKPCADSAEEGYRFPEGMLWLRAIRAPFQVPYGAILPEGVHGLLVPVALSATHVAYCAIRLEPVWAALGEAAGTAAALAIEGSHDVSDVEIPALQRTLIQSGCKLTFFSDVPRDHEHFADIQEVALAGWTPTDRHWRARPDDPITWEELIELVYRAWRIPQSVTAPHFVGIDADHPLFIAIESLYDLGSSQGIEIFPNTHPPHYDSHFEFHAPEQRTRWAEVQLHDFLSTSDATRFIRAVANAIHRSQPTSNRRDEVSSVPMTRGEACHLVADGLLDS